MTTISHSLIQNCGGSGGGWDSSLGIDGDFNIEADPLFKDLDSPYHPLEVWSYSPVIDAGNNAGVPVGIVTDVRGNPRIHGGDTVDMGAYEHQGQPTGVTEELERLPVNFVVYQNTPNPFNPSTKINFELPESATVEMAIFDLSGRLIRTLIASKKMSAGLHGTAWNGRDFSDRKVAAGVYFYQLKTEKYNVTKRMTLIK